MPARQAEPCLLVAPEVQFRVQIFWFSTVLGKIITKGHGDWGHVGRGSWRNGIQSTHGIQNPESWIWYQV